MVNLENYMCVLYPIFKQRSEKHNKNIKQNVNYLFGIIKTFVDCGVF